MWERNGSYPLLVKLACCSFIEGSFTREKDTLVEGCFEGQGRKASTGLAGWIDRREPERLREVLPRCARHQPASLFSRRALRCNALHRWLCRQHTKKNKKEGKRMNSPTTFMALVQRAKKIGQWLVIVSVLTLLLLIAGGAGLFHPASSQAGVLIAASVGNIHVGSGG